MVKENMKKTKLIATLFAIYAGGVLAQNILASKQIDLWQFTLTTGILVSPFVFIVQDVATEVFGFKVAKRMVLTGFAINLVFVLLSAFAIWLPSSQFWANQEAFSAILGTTLRISIASFTAYCVGSLANTKIMASLKEKHGKSLFFRAISSTIVGQLLDNAVFSFGAFLFVLPTSAIISMVVGATIFETCYEVIFYPITKLSIKKSQEYIEGNKRIAKGKA